MKPIIIFSHIPKTGGLTMRRFLDRHFRPGQIFKYPAHSEAHKIRLSAAQISRIRCVYGHCRFGVHKLFRRPFKYFSMVRDPLNRIISAYYFIRSSPSNRLHHMVSNMSLHDFVFSNDPLIREPLSNHQTRFISGMKNPDLKVALENIRKHYLLVGLTEKYPESVFLLNRAMGWAHRPYTRENVTKSRPKDPPVTPEMIDHIKKQNRLDYDLYAYCQERLESRLSALSPSEKRQLARYVRIHAK
ncbi:sulfotransferase family 2 domain-containing protein [Staphylospora marina]|uniref:sulfotransferase family 2 domain-containing protein n=1 Tax=Staphylospora marina TaxID=2490858 RepID=UPI0013DE1D9D|nr:sulfotransferase family 2 domain-containing protein [Staphylospora marina]